MEWQPIETAPKNDRVLIAYPIFGDGTLDVEIAVLVDEKWYALDEYDAPDMEKPFWDPTHWMPLPPPPAS